MGTGTSVSQKHWQAGLSLVLRGVSVCAAKTLLCTPSYHLLRAGSPSPSYLEKPMRAQLPRCWVTSHCIPSLW